MFIPETYTLHIEAPEGLDGIWLCLDDGQNSIPLAQFVSEDAANHYKRAANVAAAKAHAMGKSGI